jgi:hypothetical protein
MPICGKIPQAINFLFSLTEIKLPPRSASSVGK